jgi:hypothetical protein
VLILKAVKVLCFDTLLQVLILNVVSQGPMQCRLEASLASNLPIVKIGHSMEPSEADALTLAPSKIEGRGTPPYFRASIHGKVVSVKVSFVNLAFMEIRAINLIGPL